MVDAPVRPDFTAGSGGRLPEVTATPWSFKPNLFSKHSELHHYTDVAGLEGILTTNTLWATHYKDLNDAQELVLAKQPLIDGLAPLVKRNFLSLQREQFRYRRAFSKLGGVTSQAQYQAKRWVEALFEAAYAEDATGVSPFVTSFCSHWGDTDYERRNGLLSQWRGYGSENGRFAIVFDGPVIDEMLAEEWARYRWFALEIDSVSYFEGAAPPEVGLEELATLMKEGLISTIRGKADDIDPNVVLGLFRVAPFLKHRGFKEEREVRILAIPIEGRHLVAAPETQRGGRLKVLHSRAGRREHLVLFKEASRPLPIKRVIVGPGYRQPESEALARSLVGKRCEVIPSETPLRDNSAALCAAATRKV